MFPFFAAWEQRKDYLQSTLKLCDYVQLSRMVLHFLPCQTLWAKYCLGCHNANNLPGVEVSLPGGFFFQSRGNYYLIKWHPYCTDDYEFFLWKQVLWTWKCWDVSWIWTFLSSRSSWGVRVPPELLPLLLQLDVTKWTTTIDRQKNKYKVTTIKLIKMTK